MKISDVRATPVAVPLHGVIRHAIGAHWGRFVRTIVEVETDDGLIGLGELGGGGADAVNSVLSLRPALLGHDPFNVGRIVDGLTNPTAALYTNRTQVVAAIEFACLDIMGQATNRPLYELLGGRRRDRIQFASYLFYRYGTKEEPELEIRTPEQLVAHASQLKSEHGFTTHKLKAGVYPPDHELDCYRALASAFPDDTLRIDPNGVWDVPTAVRIGQAIQGLNNDYYEDPTWGMHGMRQVRERLDVLMSTNQIVVNREQLATNIRDVAVDVVLLDTTLWGGIRECLAAAEVCATFQQPVAVHSSGELGVQLATMLHLGAVLPSMPFAADAHYHHLRDDVIRGGPMRYSDGSIEVPSGPGLGITLDRDKLHEYAEEFERLGGYAYDRDPGRPEWRPSVPGQDWDDPARAALLTAD